VSRTSRAGGLSASAGTAGEPRLRLEHVGVARARAIVSGDLTGVDPGPGWPHADTHDALRMDAGHASRDDQTAFLAVLVETGQVVGDGGWKGGPDPDGSAEIGYGLSARYRGRGLGTELVGMLADWAEGQPGVTQITAEVLVGNLPSRKALERNGFVLLDRPGADPAYVWYHRLAPEVTDE
jgi:ribosomal-protein-alanine N-acetyltransferase